MASGADGKVVIDTQLNNKGFTKGLNSMKSQTNGLMGAVKKLGTTLAGVFAVKQIISFGKECVELGSNVSEVQNVVDTAFGDMAYKVEAFSETAIQNFGMSRLAAKKTASTYMAMAKGMGLADEAASDMAISLAGMTGDVASFYNISQEMADVKLKSVFTGETESLKDLGVVMTQTNLKAYALEQGITKDIAAMSQAELVSLRYGYVMKSLSLAQGDFYDTSNSWANQTRILSMQWQEFMSIVGQALITVLTPAVKVLNQIVASLISVANAVNSVVASIFGAQEAQQSNAAAVTSEIEDSVGQQEALTAATEDTAKAQKGMMAGFDEINKIGGGASKAAEDSAASTVPELGAAADPPAPAVQEAENSGLVAFFERLRDAMQPSIDALATLKEELVNVGKFTGDALIDFYNRFLAPVGSWVVGEGFPRLVDVISTGLANVNLSTITDALGRLWDALAPFAIDVGEGVLWFFESFYESVLAPLNAWVMNEGVPWFLDLITAAFTALNDVWTAVQPALQWLWENFLQPIASYVVSEVVPSFFDGLNGIFSALSSIWEDIQPALQWLWENFLQPVAEWTGGVILDVLSDLSSAFETIGNWCADNYKVIEDIAIVVGSFAAAWGLVNVAFGLWNVLTTAWNSIGAISTAVTTAFGAAVNFLTSPITLITLAIGALIAIIVLLVKHWDTVKEVASKCWEGIKEAWGKAGEWLNDKIIEPVKEGFKSFVNGLIGMVENFVNFFVRGINKVIGAVNSLNFDVPEWVPFIGGQTFGFNIPTITELQLPRLATGAVIPPNREFLAVLGDQKNGTNIEAPLSTIEQAVENVLRRRGGFGDGEMTLVLDGDLAALVRVLRPYMLKEDRRVGVNLVTR